MNFTEFCPHKIFKVFAEFRNRRKFLSVTADSSVRTESRTCCHKQLGIFWNDNFIVFEFKRFDKAAAKLIHKVKRSAKKSNVSADWLSAGKTGNRLVYYSLINGSCNILTARTFVYKRLNVRLCKNTAACCNRINSRCILGKNVQSGCICFQKCRHLVNERTCSAGASTVHTLFNAACKIRNLSIFSAKFNYNVCLRNEFFYCGSSGYDFLNKRNVQPLAYGKTA